jgi:hypothetical protein
MRWQTLHAAILGFSVIMGAAGWAAAGEAVTAIGVYSPSGQSGPFTRQAFITSVTDATGTYDELLFPTELSQTANGPNQLFYRGQNAPAVSSVADVLLDADFTDGVVNPTANGSGTINLFFDHAVLNQSGSDLFLFNIDVVNNDESWTVRPIVGGTPASPQLGGSAYNFDSGAMGATGHTVNFQFDGPLHPDTGSQGNYGIGFDLEDDFGAPLARAVGLQIVTGEGDPSVVAGVGAPLVFDMETSGDVQTLQNLTVRRPGDWGCQTYAPEELIGIDVTHFNGASGGVILAAPGNVPPQGQRAALLQDDVLNSGLINPGQGSGRAAPPEANTEGMEITFDTPVCNSAGPDIIFAEIEQDTGSPNSFWLSPTDFSDPNVLAHLYTAADYIDQGPAGGVLVRNVSDSSTLAAVESSTLSGSTFHGAGYFNVYAMAIDLSDLGFAPGARVSSLFLQSGESATVDPVFIAGLHAIPEPSTLLLMSLGLGLLVVRRKR